MSARAIRVQAPADRRGSSRGNRPGDVVRLQVAAELAAQRLVRELTDPVAIGQLVALLANPASWPSTATETRKNQLQNPTAIPRCYRVSRGAFKRHCGTLPRIWAVRRNLPQRARR